MLKYTHLLVAKRIAVNCNLTKSQSFWLQFGSVIPDCKLSCFTRPHNKENWYYRAHGMFIELTDEPHDSNFYYKLGVVLHLYCDFFTRPHSNISIHYIKDGHAKWERQLHSYIKEYYTGKLVATDEILDDLVQTYDSNDETINNDFEYITKACNILCYKTGVLEDVQKYR